MKRIISACLITGFMAAGISCQKAKDEVNEATEFSINYSTEVAIPSTSISVSTPAEFTSPEIPTTSSSRFTSEKTNQDLIEEIKMTKFNMSNPNGNLDYLDSISIFIVAANLGDLLVATKKNIPKGVSSVAADLSNANIKQHIFKDKIKFRVSLGITTGLAADQKLKIDQTVTVKGKRIK